MSRVATSAAIPRQPDRCAAAHRDAVEEAVCGEPGGNRRRSEQAEESKAEQCCEVRVEFHHCGTEHRPQSLADECQQTESGDDPDRQALSAGKLGSARLVKVRCTVTAGSRLSTATIKLEKVIETTSGPNTRARAVPAIVPSPTTAADEPISTDRFGATAGERSRRARPTAKEAHL